MAFAASRRMNDARAALDSVRATSAELTSYPGDPVLRIAERALDAEITLRSGKAAHAIASLIEAKEIEDGLTYMEPPYWHQPVRHLLGAALLAANRPAEAEQLYREDLARFPENVWSLRGLQRSLVAQRKTKEAETVRTKLITAEREQ
jgi:hypothetical protein